MAWSEEARAAAAAARKGGIGPEHSAHNDEEGEHPTHVVRLHAPGDKVGAPYSFHASEKDAKSAAAASQRAHPEVKFTVHKW